MAITRRPVGRVFIAGVGTVEEPIPDDWEPLAKNSGHLWFRKPSQQPSMGDHVFALAPGRKPPSVVVALFEVTRPGASRQPANDFNPQRWPWNLGVRPLTCVPPREAQRVPGVTTPRTGVYGVKDERKIAALYEAVGV
jgi:hypothetical protein